MIVYPRQIGLINPLINYQIDCYFIVDMVVNRKITADA